jgi:hypothetical protein
VKLYVTKEAKLSLIKKLKLPDIDSQDWEIEVSNPLRIYEFITLYEKGNLNIDEKYALMIIVLGSINDYLEKEEISNDIWNIVSSQLLKDFQIHKQTIMYWALIGEEFDHLEDGFAITNYLRKFIDKSDLSTK